MEDAIIYCRGRQPNRVSAQRRECREYCRRRGLNVHRAFVDQGKHARPGNQPALKRLIGYCQANRGNIGVLVVPSPHCISRAALDRVQITMAIEQLGICVEAVDGGSEFTTEGGLIDAILYSVLGTREMNATRRRREAEEKHDGISAVDI